MSLADFAGDVIRSIAPQIPGIIGAIRDPGPQLSIPFPGPYPGAQFGMPKIPGLNAPPLIGDPFAAGACPSLFPTGRTRVTPTPTIMERNPQSGRLHVWKHMGTPVLFSGDLAACKRVTKVASRARRARPRARSRKR